MIETWSPPGSCSSQSARGKRGRGGGPDDLDLEVAYIISFVCLCQELGHMASPKPKGNWGNVVQLSSHMEQSFYFLGKKGIWGGQWQCKPHLLLCPGGPWGQEPHFLHLGPHTELAVRRSSVQFIPAEWMELLHWPKLHVNKDISQGGDLRKEREGQMWKYVIGKCTGHDQSCQNWELFRSWSFAILSWQSVLWHNFKEQELNTSLDRNLLNTFQI